MNEEKIQDIYNKKRIWNIILHLVSSKTVHCKTSLKILLFFTKEKTFGEMVSKKSLLMKKASEFFSILGLFI